VKLVQTRQDLVLADKDAVEISSVPGRYMNGSVVFLLRLLLRRNGYVLEQLFSPLVIVSTSS